MTILVGYITYGSEEDARRFVRSLIDLKWIACGNIFPISSFYPWEGAVNSDSEWVSLLKTLPSMWPRIQEYLEDNHPYEIPCIVCWEIQVNPAYGQWVQGCCTG